MSHREEIMRIYNMISESRHINDRISRGLCSWIEDLGNGWLSKADSSGFELIEREFKILVELQDLLPDAVPEVDLDWGIECGYFLMRKINNGATLEEYVDAARNGYMSTQLFEELLREVVKILERFWDLGYVHGDLHLGNIVVGIKNGRWRPVLIDFGLSFNEAEPPELWELQSVCTSTEEDRDFFFNCLYEALEGYCDLTRVVVQFD